MPHAYVCAAGSLLGVTMNADSFPAGKVDFLDFKTDEFHRNHRGPRGISPDRVIEDMASHSGRINSVHIDQVFRAVPAQLVKTLDGSAKRFVLKEAIPGIRGYDRLSAPIGWLEQAELRVRNLSMSTSNDTNRRRQLF